MARQIAGSRSGSSNQLSKTVFIFCWFIALACIAHNWLALENKRLRLKGYGHPLDRGAIVMGREEFSQIDLLLEDDSSADEEGTSMQPSLHHVDTEVRNIKESAIPEALQPITYKKCCVPAIQANKYENPSDMECRGTCFNERACRDLSYPFANMEEMKKYGRLRDLTRAERKEMIERCLYKPSWLVPNVTWCSGGDNRIDPDNVYDNVPEPGCSHVSHGGGSGPWQNVFIFPSAKLAFCGIPKGKS